MEVRRKNFEKHYEESTSILATPEKVFKFADDHSNFSSHMTKSSWMMGGGKMNIVADEGHGQKLGSHIKMSGKIFGVKLFLDEVVTKHEPPKVKEWETVGDLSLLVIGHYRMGFEIEPEKEDSKLKVYIDYELPKSLKTLWLGVLFGDMYAKWCVGQMIKSVVANLQK